MTRDSHPMTRPLRTLLLGLLITVTLSLALLPTANAQNDASDRLHQVFDEAWTYRLQENPLFATSVGVHDYNDELPEVSVEAAQRRLAQERTFLNRLQDIDRAALSSEAQLNYDLFERVRERRIAELEHRSSLIPITNRSGFHVSFPQLPDRVPLNTVADYEDYISRLNAFERYARQHIEIMRTGLEAGYALPKVVLDDADETIRPQIVDDPTKSRLYDPFEEFPDRIGPDERERLRKAGRAAIETSVVPGFEAFLGFMTGTYVPNARDTIAAGALPNGEAYYQHKVRHHTTLDRTPKEIHETGKQEVQRIRSEMMDIVEDEGYGDDFDGFVNFLRTDDQFYADSDEELLKETSYVLKRMDGKLPTLFGTLPRMSYGIREVPDFIAPRTTTAYYRRPTGDGTRAGFYYVNTHDLPSRPLYEIEALSLHEAVPGHHLQIALQQELEGLPSFRRHTNFTAFVEGWALYAERLGLEVGFYDDPYSNFGRLSYEMWRALRLVVDTGMHALGWSRQEAIDYMLENSALTKTNVINEVDRYIAWPGQALAYKMGELTLRDLRTRAEAQLGDRFDLRAFHDAVLEHGSLPLPTLERQIDAYIEENGE
jgi:uncharacterized protein (DUF885 family)